MFTVIHLPSLTGKKMLKFSSSGGALGKFALGLTLAAVLAACGGGGSSSPATVTVVAEDTVSAITKEDLTTSTAVITSVLDKTFSFPAVPELDTPATTTLVFSGTPSAPDFKLVSDGKIVTGVMEFGSCKFIIAESDFLAPHLLAKGETVVVDPCTLDLKTEGSTAGTTDTPAVFVLGNTDSSEIVLPVTVTIAADGLATVSVAGQVVGTVPTETTAATGGAGTGG
jgi:hypothetical protein